MPSNHQIIGKTSGDKLLIEGKDPFSGKTWTLEVPREGYFQWLDGFRLIQDALPELSLAERELLISGYTQETWDNLFNDEDDDDENR